MLAVMEGRAQVDRVTRGTMWMPRREPLANGFGLRTAELGYWPIDPGAAFVLPLLSFSFPRQIPSVPPIG